MLEHLRPRMLGPCATNVLSDATLMRECCVFPECRSAVPTAAFGDTRLRSARPRPQTLRLTRTSPLVCHVSAVKRITFVVRGRARRSVTFTSYWQDRSLCVMVRLRARAACREPTRVNNSLNRAFQYHTTTTVHGPTHHNFMTVLRLCART